MTIRIKHGNMLVISRTGLLVLLAGKLILELGCQSTPALAPYTPETNTVTTTQTNTATTTATTTIVPPATTVISPPTTVTSPPSTVFVLPPTTVFVTPAPTTVPPFTTLPPATIFRTVTPPQTTSVVPSTTGAPIPTPSDRVYSLDHIWVKRLSANTVQIGITTTMVNLLSQPYALSLPQVGTVLTSGSMLGTIEGYKMAADLIAPVSGMVIQINNSLFNYMNMGTVITPIINDPYNSGWMMIIQISNPAELNSLLSSSQYDALTQTK